MVLDAILLNTQHYKEGIKGKRNNLGKGAASYPHLTVVDYVKAAIGSPSIIVSHLTIYIYIYIYIVFRSTFILSEVMSLLLYELYTPQKETINRRLYL